MAFFDPIVIGFCGPKRHGKNTAAAALTPLGFHDEAFAKPVKEICALAMHESVSLYYDDVAKEEPSETYPEDTRRKIMQEVGTDLFRNRWPDIWVRNWTRRIEQGTHSLFTCTDLRFHNEATAIMMMRNHMILRIIDPRKDDPSDLHESEMHYRALPVDDEIQNDGTIDALHTKVLEIVLARWEFLAWGPPSSCGQHTVTQRFRHDIPNIG